MAKIALSHRISLQFSTCIRRVLRRLMMLRAKARGEVFRCRSLDGLSDYNLGVQCDMSVVCNCQDTDGSGHIGDLKSDSLRGILNGRRATEMRSVLAQGKLPILTCSRCMELRRIPRKEAVLPPPRFPERIDGLMLENTIACNLKCPGCIRPLALATRTQHRLPL